MTSIDAGGSTPSYRVDDSATGVPQLVNGQLASSLPAGADRHRPTVLLLNGVGTPGLVQTACPKLAAEGFAYAGSNNAATFNNPKSTVEVDSDADVGLGDQVAHALGLPDGDVKLEWTTRAWPTSSSSWARTTTTEPWQAVAVRRQAPTDADRGAR